MILELHREGVSISDIARRTGLDRKTVRKYIARGLEPPVYSPRPPRPLLIDGFASYLRERVAAFPELTGRRLWREVRDLGFTGDYTTVTGFLRDVRPAAARPGIRRRTPLTFRFAPPAIRATCRKRCSVSPVDAGPTPRSA